MIKKVEMFTIICDNCGKDFFEGEDASCYNDIGFIEDSASESGWYVDDKHLCDECYSYDDNDRLVVLTRKV